MLNFLITPLTQLVVWFYQVTGSFGFSILLLTLVVRLVLLPLSLSSIRTQKKIRLIQPKLKALEKKHADNKDKNALRLAQMEVYREHKINPLAGLIPSLIQFVPLIAVYQVLQHFLGDQELIARGGSFFLGLDLTKRDQTFILPVLAAFFSLIQSLMILPGLEQHELVPENAGSKKLRKANETETKSQDSAAAMQKQMMFTMPIMTGLFAVGFPAGLALYWIATTIFSIVQQYLFTGWGGLEEYLVKLRLLPKKSASPVISNQELLEEIQISEQVEKPVKKKQTWKNKVKGKK